MNENLDKTGNAGMRTGIICRVIGADIECVENIEERIESLSIVVLGHGAGKAAGDADVVVVAFSGDRNQAIDPSLLEKRTDRRSLIIGIGLGTNLQVVSRGLAMGFDDFIALPVSDTELRRRFEAYRDLIASSEEFDLRRVALRAFSNQTDKAMPAPIMRAKDKPGRVLLVGRTSPLHIQLSGILGPTRFMFAQTLNSAIVQLRSNAFEIIILVDQLDGPNPKTFIGDLSSAVPDRAFAALIVVEPESEEIEPVWFQLGFSDILRTPMLPEFLRMRLGFWIAHELTRKMLFETTDIADHPLAVDGQCGLFNYGFAAEYLKVRGSGQRGREHLGLVAIRLRGLSLCNERWNCAVGNGIIADIASNIRRCVRAEDLVARIHGGLFIIALKLSGHGHLAAIRERTKSAIERLLPSLDGEPVPIRIEAYSSFVKSNNWQDLDEAIKLCFAEEPEELTA